MRIGNLAEATGTPVETIRFYEREGLIPARPSNSWGVQRSKVSCVHGTVGAPR
jgi:DNA-binding transcriptional MerR regulator